MTHPLELSAVAIRNAVFLALTTIPITAVAQQTTYSYIGAPMKRVLNGTPSQYDDMQLLGTIVLSAPLKPYQTGQIVVPISYNFDNGNPFLSSTWRDNPENAGTYSSQLFSFDTDQDGNITGWTVTIYSTVNPTLPLSQNVGMTSIVNSAGFTYDGYTLTTGTLSCYYTQGGCAAYSAYTLTPGQWQLGTASGARYFGKLWKN